MIEGLPRVVNIKDESCDVYIGRGSMWGNPYRTGRDGTREEVIRKYRILVEGMLREGLLSPEDLLELKNRRLGCYCKPKSCHGDVLVDIIYSMIE